MPPSRSRASPWEGSIILLPSFHSHLALLELRTRTQSGAITIARRGGAHYTNLRHDGGSLFACSLVAKGHGSMPLAQTALAFSPLVPIALHCDVRTCIAAPNFTTNPCSFVCAHRAPIDTAEVRAAHFCRTPASPVPDRQTPPFCPSVSL